MAARRSRIVVALLAIVIVTASVAIAAQTNTAVGDSHSTNGDFQNADTLDNTTVVGDTVQFGGGTDYNIVDDSGDGVAEDSEISYGIHSAQFDWVGKFRAEPTFNGTLSELTVDIARTENNGPQVGINVSIAKGEPSALSAGDGAVFNQSWDSPDSAGTYTIEADNRIDVNTTSTWTVIFAPTSVPSLSENRWVELSIDNDSGLTDWMDVDGGTVGTLDAGGNITLTGVEGVQDGTYVSSPLNVTDPATGWTNLSTLTNASATVAWQYNDSNTNTWIDEATATYTSPGNKTLALNGPSTADEWRVNVTWVNQSGNGAPTGILSDDGLLFTNGHPTVDNASASPQGGSELTQRDTTISIQVNDSTFSTAQGDTVTVDWYKDGSQVDTTTLTGNGTASTTISFTTGGDHTWHVEVSDSYGGTATSETFDVTVPATVDIREEREDHDLVDNAQVTVLLSGSGETVTKETISDGDLNLTGVPADESYILIVDSPNHRLRSTYLPSIYDQQTVFILNNSATYVTNTFEVDDLTGRFENANLILQKAINKSLYDSSLPAEYKWTAIAGSRLGASNRFEIDLQGDGRYRIIIRNPEGSERILGEYTAQSSGVVKLTVGELVFETPQGDGFRFDSYIENVSGTPTLRALYSDPLEHTDEVCITIHEQDNTSNVLHTQSCAQDLGNYSVSKQLSPSQQNTTWAVNWTGTRNGSTIGWVEPVGEVGDIGLPIEQRWLSMIVYVLLVGGLSATPKAAARTGALVIVALAFAITAFGWVTIPGPGLGLAGAIAVIGKAADYNAR